MHDILERWLLCFLSCQKLWNFHYYKNYQNIISQYQFFRQNWGYRTLNTIKCTHWVNSSTFDILFEDNKSIAIKLMYSFYITATVSNNQSRKVRFLLPQIMISACHVNKFSGEIPVFVTRQRFVHCGVTNLMKKKRLRSVYAKYITHLERRETYLLYFPSPTKWRRTEARSNTIKTATSIEDWSLQTTSVLSPAENGTSSHFGWIVAINWSCLNRGWLNIICLPIQGLFFHQPSNFGSSRLMVPFATFWQWNKVYASVLEPLEYAAILSTFDAFLKLILMSRPGIIISHALSSKTFTNLQGKYDNFLFIINIQRCNNLEQHFTDLTH